LSKGVPKPCETLQFPNGSESRLPRYYARTQYLDLKYNGSPATTTSLPLDQIPNTAKYPVPSEVLVRIFVVEDLDPETIEGFDMALEIERAKPKHAFNTYLNG
jgi:hypothetical protein